MPRAVNVEEYQQKRGEILDIAQRLIYTKGYEQMSIQDILNELTISKGAFYHYFPSKQALLEALIERMMQEVEKFLVPITQDPHLPAMEKFERFFDSVARWKSAQKTFLTNLLKIWYADENAIVRQKVVVAGGKWITPFMHDIIEQGSREGVMTLEAGMQHETAQVVVALMMSMGESIALAILEVQPQASAAERRDRLRQIENLVFAYRSSIERILGVPPGSVLLFNLDILAEWVLEA